MDGRPRVEPHVYYREPHYKLSIRLIPRKPPEVETVGTRVRPKSTPLHLWFPAHEALPLGRFMWAWQHGYTVPTGWPSYYIKRNEACGDCCTIHCVGWWSHLCICGGKSRWRATLLQALPFDLTGQFASSTLQEKKLILRGRILSFLLSVRREEEIRVAYKRASRRFASAVLQVLKAAAR